MKIRLTTLLLTATMVGCGFKIPPCVLDGTCVPQPSPSPTTVPPPASPSPSPSVEPSLPPPSPPSTPLPPSPSPKPPKPCKVDESKLPCWTCSARLAYDVRNGNLTWDPEVKLYYNDPPGKPREYFDRECNKIDVYGKVVLTGYEWFGTYPETEQGLCPASMLTCPSPSPEPSPSPTPVPSPTPTPSGAPPIDPATGNYPMPPEGVCPAHFRDAVAYVGIAILPPQRKCGEEGSDCTLTNLNATEKSVKPFCPHAPDRAECETWRPCQQPAVVNGNSGIRMLIAHPDWGNVFDVCDKRTCDDRFETCPPLPDPRKNFICHDRAENRSGPTQMKACEPDGTKCGPVKEYRSLP